MRIFISYRRDDSGAISDRLNERLVRRFGRENVFKDVDSIAFGQNFREMITDAIGRSDVLLVVVGHNWAGPATGPGRRLDDPKDWVRIEVEAALARGIEIIPLLADGARMPREEDLPESLRPLASLNGQPLRRDPDFEWDSSRLLTHLNRSLGKLRSQRAAEAAAKKRLRARILASKILTLVNSYNGSVTLCILLFFEILMIFKMFIYNNYGYYYLDLISFCMVTWLAGFYSHLAFSSRRRNPPDIPDPAERRDDSPDPSE